MAAGLSSKKGFKKGYTDIINLPDIDKSIITFKNKRILHPKMKIISHVLFF